MERLSCCEIFCVREAHPPVVADELGPHARYVCLDVKYVEARHWFAQKRWLWSSGCTLAFDHWGSQ